jgi:hypothetical protein
MSYCVFVRNWWRPNKAWPGGLEPNPGARKTVIRRGVRTEAEAQQICADWCSENPPGRLSRKAEYTAD